ncbi:MAG: Hsp20/alpha crystallin family protein [Bdellovibrionota bacterium]
MNIVPWRNKRKDMSLFGEQHPISALRSEVDNIFERFFGESFGSPRDLFPSAWAPSMDVAETEKDVTLKLEVPGIDPKNIEISVSGRALIIQGEKSEERTDDQKDYYHSERRFGSFRRVLDLPDSVDTESIKAEQKNGVLTISLRKAKPQNTKQIPVTVVSN